MTEITALGTFPNKPVHCIMQEEGITQRTGYPLCTRFIRVTVTANTQARVWQSIPATFPSLPNTYFFADP